MITGADDQVLKPNKAKCKNLMPKYITGIYRLKTSFGTDVLGVLVNTWSNTNKHPCNDEGELYSGLC